MSRENTFNYTYSAAENQEVQSIRSRYLPREESRLEELKALDAKVKKPAAVFACIYGSVSAIVMGAGMSLVMTDIGAIVGITSAMVPGIAIGVVGMGMALTTYPIYKKILEGRRKKFAGQIMELSEKILNQ